MVRAVTDPDHAAALDAADPLASFRERFVVDDPGFVYLDANSLGRLPKATAARLQDLVRREWGGELVRGWSPAATVRRSALGLLSIGLAASLGCGARSAISLASGAGGSPVASTSTLATGTAGATVTAATSSSSTVPGCQDATLAVDPLGAGYLALDGADLYWTTADGKVVKSASGAPGMVLAEGSIPDVVAVTVRGDDVLFADETRVLSVPKAGGAVTTVAALQSLPMAVVTDANAVYWLNRGEGILAGSLVKSVGGGPPETILDFIDTPSDLVGDDDSLYFAAAIATMGGASVSGPLVRVDKATGATTALVTGLQEPAGLAVDATRVYWIETVGLQGGFPGRVRAVAKAGGTPVDLASTQDVLGIRVSVDSAFAYLSGMEGTGPSGRGVLWRVPLGGGTFTELDHTLETLYGDVVTDASFVYFTIGWAGQGTAPASAPSVRRLCK